jgi:hypothetical protein
VKIGNPQRLRHRYRAVVVTAAGRSSSGVKERLRAVALLRDDQVTLAVLIARRASVASKLYRAQLKRLVGSLRSRPVEGG